MSMNSKDEEYREIFLSEANDNVEEINRLLTVLEKSSQDSSSIHALFRITHTLKGNAAGMGFTSIAEMAHVLEDLFGEIREGKIKITFELFEIIYKAVDALTGLVHAVKDNRVVKYKGIKTKIEVLIKRNQGPETAAHGVEAAAEIQPIADIQSESLPISEPEAMEEEEEDEEFSGSKIAFSDLVQIPVRKLDNLLNLVGELIIEKDRILASRSEAHGTNEYSRLSRISSDLQYSVMDVRLVQVGFLFNKFHRIIRDAASHEKKNVILKLEGTDTEIDRNILQVISDSLIHLIRNSVGHGIESPKEREKAGKPKSGTVVLKAFNETDAVIIEIKDDGKGLDQERIKSKAIQKGLISSELAEKLSLEDIYQLIFEPGFSTMDQVTAIAGRGVGMDVVKKTLDSIGGNISMKSEKGVGTTISLRLPASMAVKSCLLFELGPETYAIPLSYTESVISIYKTQIYKAGGGLIVNHLNKNIAIVFLKDLFSNRSEDGNTLQRSFNEVHPEQKLHIVVVNFHNKTVGLVVDKLLQQKEIVEKPLARPYDKIKFISGVTILGSGNVCLVLNVSSLLQSIFSASTSTRNAKTVVLN
jgi:two-component system chemotaxis sensor kinase CheA